MDGGIFRFEGQATVYEPGKGCYRCLYPAPPPPGAVPSCAEAGVLGAPPGIIGSIQAVETIKLILGEGDPLVNRLLLFDSLAMEFCARSGYGVIRTARCAETSRRSPSTWTMSSSATRRCESDGDDPDPTTLRAEVGGVRELDARGSTVADVIDDLVARFPQPSKGSSSVTASSPTS